MKPIHDENRKKDKLREKELNALRLKNDIVAKTK